jgi:hypothetical protein
MEDHFGEVVPSNFGCPVDKLAPSEEWGQQMDADYRRIERQVTASLISSEAWKSAQPTIANDPSDPIVLRKRFERQDEVERRANTGCAFHCEFTAHQGGELPGDGEA